MDTNSEMNSSEGSGNVWVLRPPTWRRTHYDASTSERAGFQHYRLPTLWRLHRRPVHQHLVAVSATLSLAQTL